jgi:hypothetical protein
MTLFEQGCPLCGRSISVKCKTQFARNIQVVSDESFGPYYVKVWGGKFWVHDAQGHLLSRQWGLHEAIIAINQLTQQCGEQTH